VSGKSDADAPLTIASAASALAAAFCIVGGFIHFALSAGDVVHEGFHKRAAARCVGSQQLNGSMFFRVDH